LVILITLMEDGGPLHTRQIARQLGAHHETVAEKLRSLAELGMVTRPGVHSGWYLTASGVLFIQGRRQQNADAWLPQEEPDSAELARLLNSFGVDEAENPTTGLGEGAENPTAGLGEGAENPTAGRGDNADSGENPRFEAEKTLEEESIKTLDSLESLESLNSLDSSSDLSDSNLLDSESENVISMTELLRHSGILFGEPGVLRAQLPEQPARVVLGWLAQGYAQRGRLRNPAGLVYRRLQRGEMPQARYLEGAEKYLPPAYLRAIGLSGDGWWKAKAGDEVEGDNLPGGEVTTGGSEALCANDAPDEEQVDPSLLSQVNGRTVLQAWEQALRVLQSELPPGRYPDLLREASPRRWEAEGSLVVRAPTPYARDWLRERVGRKLEGMLCGILNRQVRVVFEWEGK